MRHPAGADSIAGSRVLLIESDQVYRIAIQACVEFAGCRVDWAPAPAAAFQRLARHSVDLVVWGVPPDQSDERGEFIAELRRRTGVGLVMVDGGLEMAQLDLEAGADQWLPKPFVPGALIGAVRAALRRIDPPLIDITAQVELGGMVFDGRTRQLTFGGRSTTFTGLEWTLVHILMSRPNRFFSDGEVHRLSRQTGEHRLEGLLRSTAQVRGKLRTLRPPCRLLTRRGQGTCLQLD